MRIEFDPTNRDEATAVRAILDVMNPNGWTGAYYEAKPVDAQALTEVGERIIETQEAATSEDVPDLDANNEPHDPRIHSTPAKTNADGTWRAKRGVTAEQVAAVRAEREALTVETYVELPDDTPSEKVAEAFAEVISAAPKAPPAPPAPTGQSADPEPVVSTPSAVAPADGAPSPAPSFLDVMKAITAAQKDGKIDTAKVKELCAAVGAGESTMGLNGADKGELRVQFMALLDGEVGQ